MIITNPAINTTLVIIKKMTERMIMMYLMRREKIQRRRIQ